MNHRAAIEATFKGRAFLRPLFYSYPGGLRFELAEGGDAINRFLTAHRKALEVCRDVFANERQITVCLRAYWLESSRFAYRSTFRELSAAAVQIPSSRSIWAEEEPTRAATDGLPEFSIFVAFSVPVALLANLLWCALASDFGSIRPRPLCTVYLFNLSAGVVVLPYDDRGMDVVGPNSDVLSKLYQKHGAYLLDHDRAAMRAAFESPST